MAIDPSVSAVVQGASQAMLIEGNTEDPLNNHQQTTTLCKLVRRRQPHDQIKKQPLTAVILTVAEVLSVPAEIRYDSTEIVAQKSRTRRLRMLFRDFRQIYAYTFVPM